MQHKKKPYIPLSRAKYVVCPGCGQEQEKRDVRVYKCDKCQSVFEEADDGNYFDDPTARLRMQEARRERRNERL